jgi:hypothetical protein
MLSLSKSYIVILWDGHDKTPFALMDLGALRELRTPIATSFGEIASFAAGSIQNCQKKLGMTDAESKQADLAELIRAQRSSELSQFAGGNEENVQQNP